METLAEHEDNHQGLLDDLARFFLFNKLRYVDAAIDDQKDKEKKGKGAGPGQKAHQRAEAHSVHTNSRLLGTSTWCMR